MADLIKENFLKKTPLKISLIFIILVIIFFNKSTVFAKQTIINVPSSEVLPAGQIMLKDSNRFRPFESEGFTSITPSFTLGIGKGMELSSGIGTTLDKNYHARVRNDISAKKVWFLGHSTRFTIGGTIGPSLSESVHPDTFLYGHFSQRIKKTRTSITAGGYMNGEEHFINQGGVVLGIDQVIVPNKLRLVCDWLSGTDSYGKLGLGFKYRPTPTVSITSAVIIPTKESENIAFNISVSKYITLDDENPIKRRLLKDVD